MRHSHLLLAALLGILSAPYCQAGAQRQELADASATYQQVAPSVFLIETRDVAGVPQKFGTGFVVAGSRIVTNAHVVSSGSPFLKAGAVSVPLTVERIDVVNDLAILTTGASIDSPELVVQRAAPAVGTRVWAIGNPRGLEKSMSEGLIAGIRQLEGRTLLQISAAISHGSSGGPIVNAAGEVVGVAVASLETGQNLNFAIPADVLTRLLTGEDSGRGGFAAATLEITSLTASLPNIFDDYEGWAARRDQIETALGRASMLARTGDDFLHLASLAKSSSVADDSARAYVREALARETTNPDSARAIFLQSRIWNLRYKSVDDDHVASEVLAEANELLRSRPAHPVALLTKAISLHLLGRKLEALKAARLAVGAPADSTTRQTIWSTYHMIAGADGTAAQDDQVFDKMLDEMRANGWEWGTHAKHLGDRGEFSAAGKAYAKAFVLTDRYEEYACQAGRMFWLADSTDNALISFRTCLEINATAAYPDTSNIVFANRAIASLLNDRGVYSQAESHAREALTLADGNEGAYAAIELARALNSQGRYAQAVSAAQSAIRLSDGSLSSAHFQLGSAYFEMKDWKGCETAFRNVDRLDSSNLAAAYNLGLCLARQGFYREGARWLDSALQRHPTAAMRADIQQMIRAWRGQ